MKKIAIYGHPSCPGAFREAVGFLEKNQHLTGFLIQIPPVTLSLQPVFESLLALPLAWRQIELCLNDYGTLYYCSRLKQNHQLEASLTAGVLLSAQDTDPVLSDFLHPQKERKIHTGENTVLLEWEPPSFELRQHWQTPSVFSMEERLKALCVTRLELCSQPLPFPMELPELPITYYRQSILSVFPCKGKCTECCKRLPYRSGCQLYFHRNLLLYSGNPLISHLRNGDRIFDLFEEKQ